MRRTTHSSFVVYIRKPQRNRPFLCRLEDSTKAQKQKVSLSQHVAFRFGRELVRCCILFLNFTLYIYLNGLVFHKAKKLP